ncbi:sigma factor-like helix-turn-helix DNA-binding protein [Planomonospora venezuelensis]|uniref:RNA polymerase sigma-70 region 4 domain-containing protein n=1 Tax=Planomonospora venezuelensis TaxID=1999 RepID=A0A841CXX6_PLAVE|nr:sigma factor-like helix-turn-helix DNA-binding protein [Planomonospora venezuelensis]MBB5962270.1 hypothetical protein [Planomonospora venezuelensis]
MRRYVGFREFVQRDQRSLVGTALLLTGSHEQAIRLVLQAVRTVGLTWPPAAWESPGEHARIALYHGFLRRPTAAGPTALVRLPPRRRLIVVACLHNGRTPAELADILGLSEETVEAEVAEALDTLTKGDRRRLTNRFATQAGEASVPDLSARSLKALRRRTRRRFLLTAAALVLAAGFIVALTPQGQVWTSALAAGEKAPRTPAATGSASPSPQPAAAPGPWKMPPTPFVIRYAVPAKCPGDDPEPPLTGKILCSGWTLGLMSDHNPGQHPDLLKVDCEPGLCEAAVSLPDAVQNLGHEMDGYRELSPAVSRDGRRIAYLSAAERRYVAHDLPTGTKRYLSPALTPADIAHGPSVAVSADGRHFTVNLASGRLRTDFATGSAAPVPSGELTPAEKAAPRLDEEYPVWVGSPTGRHAAAVPGAPHGDTLHIVDAASRRVVKRVPLPPLGEPVTGEAVGWLNAREVVVELTGRASKDILGFYRVDATTGRARRLPGIPAEDRAVIGTAP